VARGKGSNQTSLKHRDGFDLFRKLSIGNLVDLFDKVFPQREVKQVSQQMLLMRCPSPGHTDVHPSCYVDARKGLIQCRSCKYTSLNLLQVFQDCSGWSYSEALKQIQAITGVRVVPEKVQAAYEDLDLHREALRLIAWAVNTHLIRMVAPPEGDTAYDPLAQHAAAGALDWLFTRRGHKKDLVHLLPYGLWPSATRLMDLCEERLTKIVDEAYRAGTPPRFTPERREKVLARVTALTAEVTGAEWTNSIAFITGHDFTTPARIKLRRPDLEDKKNGNITVLPGYQGDPNGYFGLYSPYLSGLSRSDIQYLRLLVVEGENDALTINELLMEMGITGWLCVASCGNANQTDALLDAGFEEANFLLDHPYEDTGRGELWLRERLISAKKVSCRVFVRWQELRAGNSIVKDPDDAIRLMGGEHFRKVVLDDPANTFVPADAWAIERAIEDGRTLTEVRERVAIAAKYGECLQDPGQLANYLEKIAQPLEVAQGVVRNTIVQGQDDETGFINRIAQVLKQDLHFLYKEDTPKGAVVHVHHKATQRPLRLAADDGFNVMSALSNVVGDVYEYFNQKIGMPAWLVDQQAQGAGVPMVRDLQKPIADYTRIAMQSVFHNLPARDECEQRGMGPHIAVDEKYGVLTYINTGANVYKGRPNGTGGLAWEELTGPSEGKQLFLTSTRPYTGSIKSVADLEWGNKVTLDDLRSNLDLLVKMYGCWGLRRPDDAMLCALLVFHLAAPHFCDEKIIAGITGPTGSGKSKLMATLCGGQHPELQLVDAVGYASNYSAASLYNGYHASTCLMALEEFTSDAMHAMKAKQVEDIIEILRQIIFPGGARVQRVYGGVVHERVLHTNAMVTSINPPRDIQDANRRLEIETVQLIGHRDPAIEIFNTIGPERYAQMRRQINLGLPKFYEQYHALFGAIAKELATSDIVNFKVETRFLRNFAGPATMLALLGGDWRSFVRKAVEARKDTLNAYAHATPTNTLFDTLLRTSSIRIGNAFTSIMALLAEPDKWGLLNGTTCGAFYNDEKGYLVIDWIGVLSNGGVLFRSEPWGKEQYHRLKYQLDQHRSAVNSADMASLGVEEFLRACGTTCQLHGITVLKMGEEVHTLRDMSKRRTNIGEQKPATGAASNSDDVPPGLRNPRPARNI